MWLRHGAPPSLTQAGARPVSQPTTACRTVPGDVLPYDSKFVRRFSNLVTNKFFPFPQCSKNGVTHHALIFNLLNRA
jgi:hypothetical protein